SSNQPTRSNPPLVITSTKLRRGLSRSGARRNAEPSNRFDTSADESILLIPVSVRSRYKPPPPGNCTIEATEHRANSDEAADETGCGPPAFFSCPRQPRPAPSFRGSRLPPAPGVGTLSETVGPDNTPEF